MNINSAEKILLILGFLGEKLTQPTLRNLIKEFPEYKPQAYYQTAISRFTKRGFLSKSGRGVRATFQITTRGMDFLKLKTEPVRGRRAKWDGKWRTVIFDIPEELRKIRKQFTGHLRNWNFGCLQESVWVTPNKQLDRMREYIKYAEIDEYTILFEFKKPLGLSNMDIANRCWNLNEVESRYERYLEICEELMALVKNHDRKNEIFSIGAKEHRLYLEAIEGDPILPVELMPGKMRDRAAKVHDEFRGTLRRALKRAKRCVK